MTQSTPIVADLGAGALILSTLVGWLPPIASLLAILWYGVLFYEWHQARRGLPSTYLPPALTGGSNEPED